MRQGEEADATAREGKIGEARLDVSSGEVVKIARAET